MNENQEQTVLTTEKAKAEDLFQELAEVITDSFVATYETEGNALIMRIPSGQKFRIAVEEVR